MNLDALAVISVIVCGFGAGCIAACIGYGVAYLLRADRRSRSQLRRSLGVMEAGK